MKVAEKFLKKFLGKEGEIPEISKIIIPSFIVHGAAAVLAFALIFVLTRFLGARQYGIYTYAVTVAGVLVNLSTFGINTMAISETPALLSKGRIELWKGFCKWALKNLLLICIVVTSVFALFTGIGTFYFHLLKQSEYTIPVLCACIAVPFIGLLNYYAVLTRGQHKIVISLLPDNVIKPIIFLLLLVSSAILFGGLDAYHAIFLYILAIIGGFVFAFFTSGRTIDLKKIEPQYEINKWKNTLWSFLFLTVINSISTRLDILMLGFMKSASDVGIYNAADKVAEYLIVFLSVINLISSASISKLNALDEKEKLQKMLTKSIRLVFICTIPFYIIMICFSKWIMLYFGLEFIHGQYVLMLNATALLFSIAFGPVGAVAVLTGNEKIVTTISSLRIVLNVILNLIFIPWLGINGAAIATAVTTIVWNGVMYIVVKRRTGLRTWIFA